VRTLIVCPLPPGTVRFGSSLNLQYFTKSIRILMSRPDPNGILENAVIADARLDPKSSLQLSLPLRGFLVRNDDVVQHGEMLSVQCCEMQIVNQRGGSQQSIRQPAAARQPCALAVVKLLAQQAHIGQVLAMLPDAARLAQTFQAGGRLNFGELGNQPVRQHPHLPRLQPGDRRFDFLHRTHVGTMTHGDYVCKPIFVTRCTPARRAVGAA